MPSLTTMTACPRLGNGALLSDHHIDAGAVVGRAASKTPLYVRIAEWGSKDSGLAVVDEAGAGL